MEGTKTVMNNQGKGKYPHSEANHEVRSNSRILGATSDEMEIRSDGTTRR